MNKKTKYIGSAVAVALLVAGAPVIVPMINNPTQIQATATTYDPNKLYGEINDGVVINSDDNFTQAYFTAFKNQFVNQYISSQTMLDILGGNKDEYEKYNHYSYFDPQNPAEFKDFQDDSFVKLLKSEQSINPFEKEFVTEYNDTNYYFHDVLADIKITDANGDQVQLRDVTDYDNAITSFTNGTIPFPLHLTVQLSTDPKESRYNPSTLTRLDSDLTDITFTISQNKFDITQKNSSNHVGNPVDSSSRNGDSLSITDDANKDGNKGVLPAYGKSLFDSKDDAINYVKQEGISPTASNQGDTKAIDSDGKIAKSGTYYQTVSYNLKKIAEGSDTALSAMISGGEDTNTKRSVPTYDTKITDGVNSKKAVEGTDFVVNNGWLTVVRQVSVPYYVSPEMEKQSVNVGDSSDGASNGASLIESSGNDLGIIQTTYGHKYYTDSSGKIEDTDVENDSKFNKSGIYYRKVTFTLPNVSDLDFSQEPIDETENTVTFMQEVDVKGSVDKNIETPTLSLNSSSNSNEATGDNGTENDNTLKDANGSSLVDNSKGDYFGISFGTNYYEYDSEKYNNDSEYVSDLNSKVWDNDSEQATQNVLDENGNFIKAGNYLRTIEFYLTDGAIDTHTFGNDSSSYKLDRKNNTVTYIQKVNISPIKIRVNIAPVVAQKGYTMVADSTDWILLNGVAQLTDENNKPYYTISSTIGVNIYNNLQDALTGENPHLSSDTFKSGVLYYRTITFKVDKNDDVNNYVFEPSVSTISNYIKDEENNTITFVQEITVEDSVKATVPDLKVYPGTKFSDISKDISGFKLISQSNQEPLDGSARLINSSDLGSSGSDILYFPADAEGNPDISLPVGYNNTKFGEIYYRIIGFELAHNQPDYNFDNDDKFVKLLNDNTPMYLQKISVVAPVNEQITTVYGKKGDSVSSIDMGDNDLTIDSSITDGNNSIIYGEQTTVGDEYFANASDAINNNSEKSLGSTIKGTPGTYYRSITFFLKINPVLKNDPSSYYEFDGDEGTDYLINYGVMVTLAQPIVVESESTGGSGSNVNDDWTYLDMSGVITTKSNQPYYTLNNDDNDSISNRKLAENTSWKVDMYRTNKEGVTQYRVATGEWIDAEDVILGEPNTGDDDWTYTPVAGVVTTKTTQDNYALDNHENDQIGNRGLAEDTAWVTDWYRTNHEGVEQYRVATGEWVNANDVIFKDASSGDWTYTRINGVVTTKTTQDNYALNNHENDQITNRGLAKNTAWITDWYRTNHEGVEQYRVATGEWVNVNDVYFKQTGSIDALSNLTKVDGIVNLDASSSYYSLYNQNGQLISDYSLAKNTSWKADYRAQDDAGNIYYHVGNNEWIKVVQGVSFE
ncbi:hypothetical protein [Companilactobacillus halodurans]|uniref:Surface layer protein A domain-containing protein n=1 Tax=Companilactobacillus halodurans TaxID=2584183 RepID=A0A5P0ZX90_9LACO|nr:hypothetical protein [Companilactobacillus halodurans]MQS97422.1 hypothetical protein [Companilactobacillus halodurans]